MPFVKGDSRINRKGRPPKAKPLYDREIKDMLREFIHNNLSGLQDVYNKISHGEKARLMVAVIKLVEPPPVDPIQSLTVEQIDQIIHALKTRYAA